MKKCRVREVQKRRGLVGDPEVIEQVGGQACAWQVDPGLPAAEVLDRYSREASPADAVIAAASPDADLAWWPFPEGDWRLHKLRDVLLHVITETACHAGHLVRSSVPTTTPHVNGSHPDVRLLSCRCHPLAV